MRTRRMLLQLLHGLMLSQPRLKSQSFILLPVPGASAHDRWIEGFYCRKIVCAWG